jgi:hypothetical protein
MQTQQAAYGLVVVHNQDRRSDYRTLKFVAVHVQVGTHRVGRRAV